MTSTIAYKNFVANTIKVSEKTIEQNERKLIFVKDQATSNNKWSMGQMINIEKDISMLKKTINDFTSYSNDLQKCIVSDELVILYNAEHPTIAQQPKRVKQQNTKPVRFVGEKNPRNINYAREYSYFVKNCSKISPNIQKNITNMPNNKGYIYNGIYLYGEKREEINQPTILFEKKGQTLYTHEITKTNHKIMSKQLSSDRNKKQRQTLVSNTPRRTIAAF